MTEKQILEQELEKLGYPVGINVYDNYCTFADIEDPFSEVERTFKQGFNHLVGHLAMREFRKTAKYAELSILNKEFM